MKFAPGPYKGPQRRNPQLINAGKLRQELERQIATAGKPSRSNASQQ